MSLECTSSLWVQCRGGKASFPELSHYSSSEPGIYKCKLVFSDYPWARKELNQPLPLFYTLDVPTFFPRQNHKKKLGQRISFDKERIGKKSKLWWVLWSGSWVNIELKEAYLHEFFKLVHTSSKDISRTFVCTKNVWFIRLNEIRITVLIFHFSNQAMQGPEYQHNI